MPQPRQRHRKTAVLTPQGLQKLNAAKSVQAGCALYSQACTLEALSEQTGLSPHTLSKIHAGNAGVDLRSLVRYFAAFGLTLETEDYICPLRSAARQPESDTVAVKHVRSKESQSTIPIVSWGLAPELANFYGRTTELATLKQWILVDRCRLITLLGLQGVGKTYLATRLAEQLQTKFKVVIWRSLQSIGRSRFPLPFDDFLDDLMGQLSPDHHFPTSRSTTTRVQQVITRLSQIPCLLVLDAVESILQAPSLSTDATYPLTEQHPSTAEAYNYFIKQVGQARHQSCVLLTSQADPPSFRLMSGNASRIRSLSLRGLSVADIQQMFAVSGHFRATPVDWERLVVYYDGNPLILGILAGTIQRLFQGNITDFLRQNTLIFDPIRKLLDHQFSRLSDTEKEALKILATSNPPLSFLALRSHLSSVISFPNLLESVDTLKLWSLIDRDTNQLALPPFLRDYIVKRL